MNFPSKVVLAALLGAGLAPAQEPLSLNKAVTTALEQNRSLLSARHDVSASRWGKLNAITNFLPKVELSGGVTRIDEQTLARANAAVDFIKAVAGTMGIPPSMLTDLRPFAYRDTYTTDMTIIQPVYNGGAEIVGLSAANAAEDKSQYSFEDTEQEVMARDQEHLLHGLEGTGTRRSCSRSGREDQAISGDDGASCCARPENADGRASVGSGMRIESGNGDHGGKRPCHGAAAAE